LPVALGDLPGCRTKRLERTHQVGTLARINRFEDPVDFAAPVLGDAPKQAPPSSGQVDLDDASVADVSSAGDEPLAYKPIAHPRRSRWIDAERQGEVDGALGTP
jgi:hypothetical protein